MSTISELTGAAPSSSMSSEGTLLSTGSMSSSNADLSATSSTGGPICNYDLICDNAEDMASCLEDCAICDLDGNCDVGSETPYSCPADCPASSCNFDKIIDPLTEQCDDGNQEKNDACTLTCSLNLCGDGFLFPEEKGGTEKCDDGNLENFDGCTSECVREHRLVFVSSQMYKGNLEPAIESFTGLDLADAHCQFLALVAGHSGTFRAWLSDETKSPSNRFGVPANFSGIYELPNGILVAQGWQDLTDGTLEHAIDIDEKGQTIEPSAVWTNTATSGVGVVNHCLGWTSNDFDEHGMVGSTQAINKTWTSVDSITCSAQGRLYCIQVK